MQKTPTYIGIFCLDPKLARKQINRYAKTALEALIKCLQQRKQQTENIQRDFDSFQQVFQQPKDNHHITSLFIGGKVDKLKKEQKQLFQNFKSGIQVPIFVDIFVYIPGYIMCGICFNTAGVEVANKFAHITLYLGGGAKAVQSNDVIQTLAKYALNNKIELEKIGTGKHQVSYGKFDHIYTFAQGLKLAGITGNNFVNGKK